MVKKRSERGPAMKERIRFALPLSLIVLWLCSCTSQADEQKAIEEVATRIADQKVKEQEAKHQAELDALKANMERQQQDALAQQAEQIKIDLAEQQKAKEQEARAQIQNSPNSVLKVTDYAIFDKGIINSYRQISQMTVVNKSTYSLTEIKGEIAWQRDDGSVAGKIPFVINKPIPAGDSKTFSTSDGSLENNTLQTVAKKPVFRFTSARILNK